MKKETFTFTFSPIKSDEEPGTSLVNDHQSQDPGGSNRMERLTSHPIKTSNEVPEDSESYY